MNGDATTRLKDAEVVMPTIVNGLQAYFNRSVGNTLLYRFERMQYAELRKLFVTGRTIQYGEEKEMSAVYGAEHLLRMLGQFHVRLLRRSLYVAISNYLQLHYCTIYHENIIYQHTGTVWIIRSGNQQ